jgi:hypothetical protein
VRKYITPGSVRIFGLPNTDRNFGVRDNGSGQMWSETRQIGSINYWTGDVVLAKEYVPKVRFWHELRMLLGLNSEALNVRYEYECKYKVSFLDIEPIPQLRTADSGWTGDLSLTARRRKR